MAKDINCKELDTIEKFIKDKKQHEKILKKFVEETDFYDSSAMREARILINDIFIQYVNKLHETRDKILKRIDNTPLTKQERTETENELHERIKIITGNLNSVRLRVQSDFSYTAKDKYVEETLGEIRDEKLKTELGWGIYDVICQESFDSEENMCRVFQHIGNLVAKAYHGGQNDVMEAHARRMERERAKAKAKKKGAK